MKIKRIKIEKLFGLDDNDFDIECYPNEYVTILYAFNGVGKTTLLRLVDAVLSMKMQILDSIAFKKIEIYFDNGEIITVEKNGDYRHKFADTKIKDLFFLSKKIPIYPISYCINYKNEIKYYYLRLSSELTNLIIKNHKSKSEIILKGLMENFNELDFHYHPYNYFDSEDLQSLCDNDSRSGLYYILRQEFQIQGVFANKDYNRLLSDSVKFESSDNWLEQNFEAPFFENYNTSDTIYFSRKELQKLWAENNLGENGSPYIDKETLRYIKEKNVSAYPVKLDDKVISVCMKIKEFLSMNEHQEKLNLYLQILNTEFGFMYKTIALDSERGLICIPDYRGDPTLDLVQLSSGEKNLIVLFYELIFETYKNNKQSIVLIDEPETSLHIEWQQNLVKNIMNICKTNNIQVILATHSPDIVDEYWGLQSEMISARFKSERE